MQVSVFKMSLGKANQDPLPKITGVSIQCFWII